MTARAYNPLGELSGGRGPMPITGTSAYPGQFYALEGGTGGCTINALTIHNNSGTEVDDGIWDGYELREGQQLFWEQVTVVSITLTSGAAIAYRR